MPMDGDEDRQFEAAALDPTGDFEREESFEATKRATLGKLTGRELEIANERWLGGATLSHFAKRWGCTIERVRQIEVSAKKRIINNMPMQKLKRLRRPTYANGKQ
jgi:DNA-directed RNA polymerase sigma subunit (sigma70/sigma32)